MKYYELEDVGLSQAVLSEALAEYKRPNDKISYMIEKGELTHLARGFYAYTNYPNRNLFLNYHIANIIYGVSYISRYTALDHYSLISDGVVTYESMTMKRSKEIINDRGRFTYHTLAEEVFPIGLRSIAANEVCTYIMATPEKALCDIIWTSSKLPITSYKDMLYFLEEDLRFDMDYFAKADVTIFEECMAKGSKKNMIKYLIKMCNAYQDA